MTRSEVEWAVGDLLTARWTSKGRNYVAKGKYAHTDPLGGIWFTTAAVDNGNVIRRVRNYRLPATRQAVITKEVIA